MRISLLANPAVFLRITKPVLPIIGILALGLILSGTIMAFFFSPPDFRQGESVRMMYVHVPAAWMALQCYAVIAIASLVGFIWRHRLADIIAREAAPMGLAFTFLALVTGSLWGKVTWGVFWDWDPRMTSMLVLLFIYVGYIVIWRAIESEATAARMAALLAMIGAINLPIIKFSVYWWDSLHQQSSIIKADGPSIPVSMLWPMFLMAFGYMALSMFFTLLRTRTVLRQMEAGRSVAAPSTATMEPAQ